MGLFNRKNKESSAGNSSWDAPIVAKFNEINGNIEVVRTQTSISNAPFFGFIPPNEYDNLNFGFRKLNGEVLLFFQDTVKSALLKKSSYFKLSFEGDKIIDIYPNGALVKLPKVGKSLVKNELQIILNHEQIETFKSDRLLTIDLINEGQLPIRYSIPATIAYTDKVTGDAPIQIIRIFRKIANF